MPSVGDTKSPDKDFTLEELLDIEDRLEEAIEETNFDIKLTALSSIYAIYSKSLGGVVVSATLLGLDLTEYALESIIKKERDFYKECRKKLKKTTYEKIVICQKYEYRMWRFYGDRFFAWYPVGSPEATGYK